ncbi:MAG: hypothetical protein ACI4JI_06415 [Ruminiclostridium sp.]
MSGHRFGKIEYTIIDIPEKVGGEEWKWCYSARKLQQELQQKFKGQRLKAVYVDLEGYLESSHNGTDLIDLSCESGGCKVFFDNAVLELGLHVEGQFEYRIVPLDVVKTRDVKDYPPNDFRTPACCYFDIQKHDITVKIADQIISDIRVAGTDTWCFSLDDFDEAEAELASYTKDLPAEIDLCTDTYTICLIGDYIEYFYLKIEKQIKADI